MSDIVIFHSALGLRPAIHDFADSLRAAGHDVHTPDLFDGEVFDHLTEGVAKRDRLGIAEIARRATAAAEGGPAEAIYVGFSLGAGPAQMLAQTRPGARGAVLLHGALAPAELGRDWPANVPVQIHVGEDDPWVDHDAARELAHASAEAALHRYPAPGHLFTDHGSADHDPRCASLALDRAREFCSRVAAQPAGGSRSGRAR